MFLVMTGLLTRRRENLRKDIFWRWRFSRGRWLSRWWNVSSLIFSIVAIAWFVLAVELTLSWNSVSGVYDLSSTGQLIPFIIGLLGLIRAIHSVIMELLKAVRSSINQDSASRIAFLPLAPYNKM